MNKVEFCPKVVVLFVMPVTYVNEACTFIE